jgi:hypothetical protein
MYWDGVGGRSHVYHFCSHFSLTHITTRMNKQRHT